MLFGHYFISSNMQAELSAVFVLYYLGFFFQPFVSVADVCTVALLWDFDTVPVE